MSSVSGWISEFDSWEDRYYFLSHRGQKDCTDHQLSSPVGSLDTMFVKIVVKASRRSSFYAENYV
jgi:hypothetical protein